MADILPWLTPIAVGAVAVVLFLGLFNLLRGGPPNVTQRLMRWRVVLQFVAVIILMAALYWQSTRGG